MKKIYLLAGCAFLFNSVTGQRSGIKEAQLKPSSEEAIHPMVNQQNIPSNRSSRAFGDTIWYQDFAGGIPAGWTVVDNTGNGYEWIHDTQAPGGDYTTQGPIQSTTSSNGFMSLRSDFYNSPYDPNTLVAMDSYFQTDAIDCSALGSVILRFQQYFRWCCGSTNQLSVFVSTDGANWTEYDVRGKTKVNNTSPDGEQVYLNISAVAANEPTVYLRFHKIAASHYFWMVDDIAIMEGPENDLWLNKEFVDFNYTAGGFYTQMPGSQLSELVSFRGAVFNNGFSTQSDVTLTVEIDSMGATPTSVFISSFTEDSMQSLVTDTFQTAGPFTPGLCPASYDVSFSISQNEIDEDPGRNSITTSFEISDTVYARDYGTAHSSIGTHNYVGGGMDDDEIGVLYEFLGPDEVTSVSMYLTGSSDMGNSISVKLYEADENAASWADYTASFNLIDMTPQYTITAADTADWLTIGFLSPVAVSAGDHIVSVVVHDYSQNTPRFGQDLAVNQPDGMANNFMYFMNDVTWYTSPGQIMLRLGVVGADTTVCGSAPCSTLTVNSTATNASCNGEADGAIDLAVSGGNPGYTYSWSNGANTQNISGISAGSYFVTVTDLLGCMETSGGTVTEPSAINISISITDADCGQSNGVADASGTTGGAGGFSYAWSSGQATNIISGISAGTYGLTVTDMDGCIATETALISNVGAPTLNTTVTDASCNGASDGEIEMDVTGTAAPYTYLWSNGATTQNISNIPAGTYYVSVEDGNNCIAVTGDVIAEPSEIVIDVSITDALCSGLDNGAIDISASGGAGGLTYLWNTGATIPNLSGIAIGNYSLTVTDTDGCSNSINAAVNGITSITVNETNVTHETSLGAEDGTIDISVNGGTPGYNFLWSNGATTQNISNLGGDTYTVSVTDSAGCLGTLSVLVENGPTAIVNKISKHQFKIYPNPNHGEFNLAMRNTKSGTYLISVNNMLGQQAYTERLIVPEGSTQKTMDLSDLGKGVYFFSITDENSKAKTVRKIVLY